jgi:hypothetical protein
VARRTNADDLHADRRLAVVFHSLTTEVDGNGLRWYFGPGLWTYRLALEEIRNVAVVRNRWWNGFGIRTAPGFPAL